MLSSLGWTTTMPCPEKAIWKASPLPRPIRDCALKLRLPFTLRFGDQATSASGSTYVSSSPPPQSTTMGLPREVRATQPCPEILVFHRPWPANFASPLTRSTPQVRWRRRRAGWWR